MCGTYFFFFLVFLFFSNKSSRRGEIHREPRPWLADGKLCLWTSQWGIYYSNYQSNVLLISHIRLFLPCFDRTPYTNTHQQRETGQQNFGSFLCLTAPLGTITSVTPPWCVWHRSYFTLLTLIVHWEHLQQYQGANSVASHVCVITRAAFLLSAVCFPYFCTLHKCSCEVRIWILDTDVFICATCGLASVSIFAAESKQFCWRLANSSAYIFFLSVHVNQAKVHRWSWPAEAPPTRTRPYMYIC